MEELWGLRSLLVPETTLEGSAVPELAMAEVVTELLPTERLDAAPEPAEEAVEVGPVLTLAEEDGRTAEESQLRTSNATVPLIVMKCATLYRRFSGIASRGSAASLSKIPMAAVISAI